MLVIHEMIEPPSQYIIKNLNEEPYAEAAV